MFKTVKQMAWIGLWILLGIPSSFANPPFAKNKDIAILVYSHLPTAALSIAAKVNKFSRNTIQSKEFYNLVMKKRPIYESLGSTYFRKYALEEMQTSAGRLRIIRQLLDVETQFVQVPAGAVRLGRPASDGGDDLEPVRYVYLDHYRVHKYPVTQLLAYLVEVEAHPNEKFENRSIFRTKELCPEESYIKFEKTEICAPNPIEGYSWNWISNTLILDIKNLGFPVRMLTEAEYERAARGDQKNLSTFNSILGWLEGLSNQYAWTIINSEKRTHAVGMLLPNSLGLYDMYGNVASWVSDWYDYLNENLEEKDPVSNPKGPEEGVQKVFRGCSWGDYPKANVDDLPEDTIGDENPRPCTQATRSSLWPHMEGKDLGLHKIGIRLGMD